MNHAITARAHSNIALIKYWGKQDLQRNLPAVGSLSLTLNAMHSTTTVRFDEALSDDEVLFNGQPASAKEQVKFRTFLDRVRTLAQHRTFAHVDTANNFPTASGLASSASGFAALALASTHAAGLTPDLATLAELSRLGSGSAVRSLLGGLVLLPLPENAADTTPTPQALASSEDWDLRLLVAVNGQGTKTVSSTEGMEHSRKTSDYYPTWLQSHPADLHNAAEAIQARDFQRLGELTEASCYKMHACMMASRPPLLYWNGITVDCMQAVWALRNQGVEGYVTIDAGPHVKVLCLPEAEAAIATTLSSIPGVRDVLHERAGQGAEILSTSEDANR